MPAYSSAAVVSRSAGQQGLLLEERCPLGDGNRAGGTSLGQLQGTPRQPFGTSIRQACMATPSPGESCLAFAQTGGALGGEPRPGPVRKQPCWKAPVWLLSHWLLSPAHLHDRVSPLPGSLHL